MRSRTPKLPCLRCGLIAIFASLYLAAPAQAVITVLIPMLDIVEKEDFIFIAKVKEILPDKPAMVLVFDENLKGTSPFERMPVGLSGDAEAKKGKHTAVLLDRIDKDTPIVVITTKRGGKYIAFGYTNGTWFQMDGRIEKTDGKEVVRWSFLHCEPYLRRTFKGTTEEFKQVVTDVVAKKKAAPAPDEKEAPGFGPPIKKISGVGYPLAVIQLPFLGLIAALAALFPTVFGGLALFMKRWVAVLSTGGFVSMFAALPMFLPGWTGRQWIFSPSGIWLSCAILFSLGAVWSLRRYRKSIDSGASEVMQPRKFDRIVLSAVFAVGLAALLVGADFGLPIWSNEYWRWALAGTAAFGIGGYYIVTTYLRSAAPPLRVSAESVMLWVLAGSCVAFGSWEAGKFSSNTQVLMAGGGVGHPSLQVNPNGTLADPIWRFKPQTGGSVVNTCATPERIYVAVMMIEGLTGKYGRIYALDPETGNEIWQFDNDYANDSDKGMKLAFSAPVFADGRLYFGEGLHTDNDSRLFCLDAESGKKLWEYKTESHTESTPFVFDGKVVIGAGYHGIHCVDAVNGPGPDNTPLWIYPKDARADARLAHVDCNPAIANGRVYAGSGYKPDYVKDDGKINRIFCLDLNTGDEVWSERVEDAVYGSPLVHDGKVFFGTGNSTYSEKHPSQRPGILCRDAVTGDEVWNRILPECVMARPAADKRQLFVGCLDGKAYALDLRTGEINWSIEVGAAVLAAPVIEIDEKTGTADVLYLAGKQGNMLAVSPYSGKPFWSVPISYWTNKPVDDLSATPTLLRFENDDEVRHRLFIGFGQGRSGSSVPRLICIEDRAKKK